MRTGAIDDFKARNAKLFQDMGTRAADVVFTMVNGVQGDANTAKRPGTGLHSFPSSLRDSRHAGINVPAGSTSCPSVFDAMHEKTRVASLVPVLIVASLHLALLFLI